MAISFYGRQYASRSGDRSDIARDSNRHILAIIFFLYRFEYFAIEPRAALAQCVLCAEFRIEKCLRK